MAARPDVVLAQSLRDDGHLTGAWSYDATEDAALGVVPPGDGSSDGNVGGHGSGGQHRVDAALAVGTHALYTWDLRFGAEWADASSLGGLSRHKAFMICQADNDKWIETSLDYTGGPSVATIAVRPYLTNQAGSSSDPNTLGPGWTYGSGRIQPRAAVFAIHPQRWTRIWYAVHKAAPGSWSTMSLWAADEVTDPMLIYDGVELGSTGPFSDRLWVEFNTSQVRDAGSPSLRVWVRNVVVLDDVTDPAPLLVRPDHG